MGGMGEEKRRTTKISFYLGGRGLGIPLGFNTVDIGSLYSFKTVGVDFIKSFDTQTLHKEYNLPAPFAVEVGGNSFKTRYYNRRITVFILRFPSPKPGNP